VQDGVGQLSRPQAARAKRSAYLISFPLNSAIRQAGAVQRFVCALLIWLRRASAGLYSALHLRVVGVSVVELGGQCRPASVGIRACRLRKRSEAECSASVGLGGTGWL